MNIKTAEDIAALADSASSDLAARRIINKAYRAQDESHLWPIRGRFNVTNRAIRRVNAIERHNGAMRTLEYCYAIESVMSEIVNSDI